MKTYPWSFNFSTSSMGLLPPISRACLWIKGSTQWWRNNATQERLTYSNDTYVNCGNFSRKHCITSLIWRASSRVGVITRAPTCAELQRWHPQSGPPKPRSLTVFSQGLSRCLILIHTCIFFSFSSLFRSSSMTGMTKASVFPLPVTCNDHGNHCWCHNWL